nr:hypothetical protein [Tanacetum cinerariifolium]
LNSKLLLINSNSQRLDKKDQEVKNVVEQPAEHGNRSIQSLQNFRVIHKSSISVNSTSQISSIHSIAPIQSTKKPEHLLSMGKCEVTLKDEIECDVPAKDNCSPVFTTFSNPLFKDNDNFDSSDDESLPDEDVPAEEFKIYLLLRTFYQSQVNASIENFADDPEGDIRFLDELLIDDSILSHESYDSNFEDNPLIPRPPPKPPDVETDAGEDIAVVMIDNDKFDDDYQIFMFDKDYPLEIEVILCRI